MSRQSLPIPADAPGTPKCPVCSSTSSRVWNRSAEEIREDLNAYIHPLPDVSLIGRDYSMYLCGNCTLTFADPLIAGDGRFYDWLTTCSWYYPVTRWEFSATSDLLRQRGVRTVLEVGCGNGTFLRHMKAFDDIRVIGLDLSADAIADCRAQGFDAHLCDVNEYRERLQVQLGPVDAVVSFHCLEHLANPISFIRGMWNVVSPRGAVYVSTPYSPLHYERRCGEPLNRPPHHMTCWNIRSYAALARSVNLQHRTFLPAARSVLERTRNTLAKWDRSVQMTRGRKATLFHALAHPLAATAELLHQLRREKVHGIPASDEILVEFTAPKT